MDHGVILCLELCFNLVPTIWMISWRTGKTNMGTSFPSPSLAGTMLWWYVRSESNILMVGLALISLGPCHVHILAQNMKNKHNNIIFFKYIELLWNEKHECYQTNMRESITWIILKCAKYLSSFNLFAAELFPGICLSLLHFFLEIHHFYGIYSHTNK